MICVADPAGSGHNSFSEVTIMAKKQAWKDCPDDEWERLSKQSPIAPLAIPAKWLSSPTPEIRLQAAAPATSRQQPGARTRRTS